MVAKVFPKGHIDQGKPTNFKEKILAGEKTTTIRCNYRLWKKRMDNVDEGQAIIEFREWEGKPYRSKQIPFASICNGIISQILLDHRFHEMYAYQEIEGDEHLYRLELPKIAEMDGLTLEQFKSWFKSSQELTRHPHIFFGHVTPIEK